MIYILLAAEYYYMKEPYEHILEFTKRNNTFMKIIMYLKVHKFCSIFNNKLFSWLQIFVTKVMYHFF